MEKKPACTSRIFGLSFRDAVEGSKSPTDRGTKKERPGNSHCAAEGRVSNSSYENRPTSRGSRVAGGQGRSPNGSKGEAGHQKAETQEHPAPPLANTHVRPCFQHARRSDGDRRRNRGGSMKSKYPWPRNEKFSVKAEDALLKTCSTEKNRYIKAISSLKSSTEGVNTEAKSVTGDVTTEVWHLPNDRLETRSEIPSAEKGTSKQALSSLGFSGDKASTVVGLATPDAITDVRSPERDSFETKWAASSPEVASKEAVSFLKPSASLAIACSDSVTSDATIDVQCLSEDCGRSDENVAGSGLQSGLEEGKADLSARTIAVTGIVQSMGDEASHSTPAVMLQQDSQDRCHVDTVVMAPTSEACQMNNGNPAAMVQVCNIEGESVSAASGSNTSEPQLFWKAPSRGRARGRGRLQKLGSIETFANGMPTAVCRNCECQKSEASSSVSVNGQFEDQLECSKNAQDLIAVECSSEASDLYGSEEKAKQASVEAQKDRQMLPSNCTVNSAFHEPHVMNARHEGGARGFSQKKSAWDNSASMNFSSIAVADLLALDDRSSGSDLCSISETALSTLGKGCEADSLSTCTFSKKQAELGSMAASTIYAGDDLELDVQSQNEGEDWNDVPHCFVQRHSTDNQRHAGLGQCASLRSCKCRSTLQGHTAFPSQHSEHSSALPKGYLTSTSFQQHSNKHSHSCAPTSCLSSRCDPSFHQEPPSFAREPYVQRVAIDPTFTCPEHQNPSLGSPHMANGLCMCNSRQSGEDHVLVISSHAIHSHDSAHQLLRFVQECARLQGDQRAVFDVIIKMKNETLPTGADSFQHCMQEQCPSFGNSSPADVNQDVFNKGFYPLCSCREHEVTTDRANCSLPSHNWQPSCPMPMPLRQVDPVSQSLQPLSPYHPKFLGGCFVHTSCTCCGQGQHQITGDYYGNQDEGPNKYLFPPHSPNFPPGAVEKGFPGRGLCRRFYSCDQPPASNSMPVYNAPVGHGILRRGPSAAACIPGCPQHLSRPMGVVESSDTRSSNLKRDLPGVCADSSSPLSKRHTSTNINGVAPASLDKRTVTDLPTDGETLQSSMFTSSSTPGDLVCVQSSLKKQVDFLDEPTSELQTYQGSTPSAGVQKRQPPSAGVQKRQPVGLSMLFSVHSSPQNRFLPRSLLIAKKEEERSACLKPPSSSILTDVSAESICRTPHHARPAPGCKDRPSPAADGRGQSDDSFHYADFPMSEPRAEQNSVAAHISGCMPEPHDVWLDPGFSENSWGSFAKEQYSRHGSGCMPEVHDAWFEPGISGNLRGTFAGEQYDKPDAALGVSTYRPSRSPAFLAVNESPTTAYATRLLSDNRIPGRSGCMLNGSFKTKYIDTHCHLDLLFRRQSFSGTFSEYRTKHKVTFPQNFEGCVAVFCNPKSFPHEDRWRPLVEDEGVWMATGCHPKSSPDFDEWSEVSLRNCLKHDKVVALGEIGLDYSKEYRLKADMQKKVFEQQIKIAVELQLPLVIHCREADDDCFDIMKKNVPHNYKIHCHCFTSTFEVATRWMSHFTHLYFGLTPLVTFTSAKESHRVAQMLPLDKLLLETDAPYFLPSGFSNSTYGLTLSHPGMALTVAIKVAELKKMDVEDVLAQVRQNTQDMYGI